MNLPSCFWKTGAIVLGELPSFISRAANSPRWRKQRSPTRWYVYQTPRCHIPEDYITFIYMTVRTMNPKFQRAQRTSKPATV